MEQVITALRNERVKQLRKLREKKARQEQGLFLADGPHLVEEAVKGGAELALLVVEEQRLGDYGYLLEQAACPRMVVSREVMEAVSDTQTPQGILAAVRPVLRPFSGATGARLLLILDHLQDPGNMGTMIRTADAAGADGVLLSADCVDVHNPKCVRATMGSLFHLPLWETTDLPAVLERLTAEGWAVFCGQLDGENFFERQVRAGRQALIIGNEAAGVSEAVSARASHRVRLPMAGKAESLNAAVAAGIMIYDLARAMGRLEEGC